jgi:hypothetical protein
MAFFTYISKSCKQDAERYGKQKEVEALAAKIEKDQSISNLESYGTRFLCKRLGKEYRLIIALYNEEEDNLLILWRLFLKGDKHYDQFWQDLNSSLLNFEKDMPQNELKKLLKERKEQNKIKPLPELSPDERDYLFGITPDGTFHSSSLTIIESKDWAEKLRGDFKPYGAKIHEAIFALCDRIPSSTVLQQQTCFSIENTDITIMYIYLDDNKTRTLFLIAPVHNDHKEELNRLHKDYCSEGIRNVLEEDKLRKRAYRAYPADVVWDPDIWLKYIEFSDERANIALSEEECGILNSVKDIGYPLFINGRPGSGKSTILQYLFAEHLLYYLESQKKLLPPLYLTYSQALLDTAKEIVKNILKSNAKKIEKSVRIDQQQLDKTIDQSFACFRDFLIHLLNSNLQYDMSKFIDYPRFRDYMVARHDNKRISPEIAWHVIRTYVKGFNAEKDVYLTPDDYAIIPRKRKSVTQETFQEVYERIWESWYSKMSAEGYWDDQDLARNVLSLCEEQPEKINLSNYPAIFCDEAQDFTHNELRLIYRLSLFSRRRLKPDFIKKIPFAFAGDPFQTLNPTGFDWEATKASFHETIIQQLLPGKAASIEMNWRNLDFNYRCNKSIVQLCNVIHLMRGVIFQKKYLKPQKPYYDDPTNMPVYFDIESPVCRSKMREQNELVTIVPCQEGEELRYVKDDPFLSEIALGQDQETITRNVLSPIKAKGLEFKRVVVYKFGNELLNNNRELLDYLEGNNNDAPNTEKSIPVEYLVNRLYVAASRAKNRLIIVDTDKAIRFFWKKYFENSQFFDGLIKRYKEMDKNSEWTLSDLGILTAGDASIWDKDQDAPEELAEQFMKQGYAQRDILKLTYARDNYERARKEDKAKECQAYIYEFENKLKDAAQLFLQLGKGDRALELFWQSKSWDEILQNEGWNGFPEYEAAHFCQYGSDYKLSDKIGILNRLTLYLKEDKIRLDSIWDDVIADLIRSIYEDRERTGLPQYEWDKILKNAQEFKKRGILLNSIKIIENIQAMTLVYPDNIEPLFRMNNLERIVNEYRNNKDISLDERQSYLVLSSILERSSVEEALDFLKDNLTVRNVVKLLSCLTSKSDPKLAEHLFDIFKLMGSSGQWIEAVNLVTGALLNAEPDDLKIVREFDWGKMMDVEFIKYIAVSDDIINQPNSTKTIIANYLYERLTIQAKYYQNLLSPIEAGAALERAGMVKYCLSFYELIINQKDPGAWKASDEDIFFAKKRWLVCKRRNLALAKTDKRKREIYKELNENTIQWGFNQMIIDAEPEFPKLPETKTSIDSTKTAGNKYFSNIHLEINFKLDGADYECELIREKAKMRIIKKTTREMISIKGTNMEIDTDDDDLKKQIKEIRHEENEAVFFLGPWNMTFIIKKIGGEVFAKIMAGEQISEILTLSIS